MEPTPEQIKAIFLKLLARTATAEEKEIIRPYLNSLDKSIEGISPDLLLPYEEWQTVASDPLPEGTREKVIQFVLEKEGAKRLSPFNAAKITRRWLPYAAAFLALAAGIWLFRGRIPNKGAYIVRKAPLGSQDKVLLPDGSTVYLNAGSEISFPTTFSASNRQVALVGQAFFEVAPDPARSFIVNADSIKVTVLGTSFDMKAYAGDRLSVVAVSTGKVRIDVHSASKGVQSLLLLPKQAAIFNKVRAELVKSDIRLADIDAWKENRLVFDEVPLADILKSLERKYGVTFRCSQPGILDCTYSIRFDQNTLAEALGKLKLLGDLDFRQKDSIITVTGRNCIL